MEKIRKTIHTNRLSWLLINAQLNEPGTVKPYQRLAVELGMQLMPTRNWTWNYLHSVVNLKIRPSKRLCQAIEILFNAKNKSKTRRMERVTVLAPVGAIPKNTIISGSTRTCKRLACRKLYLPKSPSQKFCTPECRQMNTREEALQRNI